MEQKNTHRLTKVAKELNVGVNSLIEFFNKKGISKLRPNSKIDNAQYQMALNKFGDEKLIKEKIREQKELEAKMKKTTISLDDVKNEKIVEDDNENIIEQSAVEKEHVETTSKNSKKKLSAFIWVLIIIGFIFYFMVYGSFYYDNLIITPIVGILLIIAFIYLLIRRFKELDSGQEDDLDKY